MIYISINYYLLVIAALVLYYLFPMGKRWIVLLVGNICFYLLFYKTGWPIFLVTIVVSFAVGIVLPSLKDKVRDAILAIGIIAVLIPWLGVKYGSWIVPMGISFYTLQITSYMVDVYHGKIEPEKNIAKYMLFTSFFPQLIQGPIPRYSQLAGQLMEGHEFDERKAVKGFCYIIWGFFLKLVIADKAAVIVDEVFDNFPTYTGIYVWLAAGLYSIQLYTDFLACTKLAQGVSKLFGIEVIDNFASPFLAVSIKDYWRRWHISLSTWLRDYLYIPLGGNRKGKVRRYINLAITFLISGIWHGSQIKYLAWGLIQAVYQIVGELTEGIRDRIYKCLGMDSNSKVRKTIKRIITFWLVTFGLLIFRAQNLIWGLEMIKDMFVNFKVIPGLLSDEGIFALGLEWKEILVLILAIYILWLVDKAHECKMSISDRVIDMKLPVRWGIYIVAIIAIMVLGTYGYGYSAQDFIYGGF
jgi:D-alanyl-lipoteichoic acid acyltransferase DltB (MBOAT superfamily)